MNRDDGGPAFPVPDGAESMPGMTLRDHFAGMAMQGLICDPHPQCSLPSEVAETAYLMADAMLKARKA